MNKKLVFGILIAAGLVYLLTQSKPEVKTAPEVNAGPSDADSPAIQPNYASSPDQSPRTFAGDPCTNDCSGHEAGYNWAEEHDIDDEGDCDTAGDDSNSPSFAEGCRDYVDENKPDDQNN